MRFTGTRRFGIVEPNAVEVLVKEVEPTPDPCPLAIKITKFEGTVLHFSPVGTDVSVSDWQAFLPSSGNHTDKIKR